MMNKQKTSKAWSWKVATFLPLLALLLMAFGREGKNVQMEIASSAIESPSITNETPSITGTWRLASYNYGGGDEWKPAPEGIVKIKLITETSFSWNHYVGTDKRVVDSAGGSYVLSGEDYTETVEYGGSGMADYVGKEQKFKVKIEKDKMELSGELSSGLKIKEIWVRYHTSDQTSTSQNVNLSQDKPDDQVYLTAEVMAEFPGGDRAMREYIANNVKYPKEAEEKRIQGKVYVTFIVNSQGKIVNPKIVKGAAPALDAEAIRVVQSMPTWIPGKNKGVPVSLSYTTPINFVLQ